jgi:hypothetical protein
VKLADLYRDIAKNPWNSCSSVQHDCPERESSRLNVRAKKSVRFFGFALYPRPTKILFYGGRSRREEGVFAEMRRIKNTHNRLRRWWGARRYLNLIQYFSYGAPALLVSLLEVFDRLAFPHMIAPDIVMERLLSSFVLKLFAALSASIVLYISPLSVLFYRRMFTVQALFLDMVCSF